MKQTSIIIRSNVDLVAFAGKERGSLGSKVYAVCHSPFLHITDILAYHAPKERSQLRLLQLSASGLEAPSFLCRLTVSSFFYRFSSSGVTWLIADISAIYGLGFTVGLTASWISIQWPFQSSHM
ncbi:hypothetical protein EDD17DRAFT_1649767, partial [Pisolithus thermaeus]